MGSGTVYRAESPIAAVILAHGAGAGQKSPWMVRAAKTMAERNVTCVTFDFPYITAGKKVPDRAPVLEEHWRRVLDDTRGKLDGLPVFIGGKSMGGRIASMVADELGVAGVVCLGYPFHPPGKPDRLRTAHLEHLATPALILQGERDTFGTRAEVEGYALSEQIEVRWFTDGDHSLKPRKASGHTEAEHLAEAARLAAAFVKRVAGR